MINRRAFFGRAGLTVASISPLLGMFGMRFHAYTMGAAGGYSGWVTWLGRVIAFVPKDGGKWWWL